MNRSDIIKKISELYPKLNRKEIEVIVKELFSSMASSIATGKRIEIRVMVLQLSLESAMWCISGLEKNFANA